MKVILWILVALFLTSVALADSGRDVDDIATQFGSSTTIIPQGTNPLIIILVGAGIFYLIRKED